MTVTSAPLPAFGAAAIAASLLPGAMRWARTWLSLTIVATLAAPVMPTRRPGCATRLRPLHRFWPDGSGGSCGREQRCAGRAGRGGLQLSVVYVLAGLVALGSVVMPEGTR